MYDPMAIRSLSSFTTVQLTNKSCAKNRTLSTKDIRLFEFRLCEIKLKKHTVLSFRQKIKVKMKKMTESGLL